MRHLLLAAFGGALGAGARHLINVSFLAWFGPGFPWATFTVNILGSLLMGALVEALMSFSSGADTWRVFLATGILGGFTTFSAFSLDIWVLYERGQHIALALYLTLSVILSVGALVSGMALVRALR
ncbi:fluoride efflux transporter CrcB [Hyphomicrobium sp. CS1BSMeth3]|uniref:fluoride efflux transporter CrcB n=1 Tax=Hyphomicrobium sp. CS1BSMeth3 TaxID=1892844 RepID=UPI000930E357|nr:fluoride efflux transporter CrcB [Hyphomicrobium sp. CS1BSMeth3]MBN9262991.1 fluoride efflux transporter CrcB [Hyphomicrobium sp.]